MCAREQGRLEDITQVGVYVGDSHGERRLVGTLVQAPGTPALFSYDAAWVVSGWSISPLSLPLRRGVFEAPQDAQDMLFGIFRDSLPDDWGRLVQDRTLMATGCDSSRVPPLARLSLVGNTGLGALEYIPMNELEVHSTRATMEELMEACREVMRGEETKALGDLYAHAASSGGARPKVMVDIDGEDWIVKLPLDGDMTGMGEMELEYSRKARACGIDVPAAMLVEGRDGTRFFASRRFDRERRLGDVRKVHMASAAALLEASPFDTVDYHDLMDLTLELCGSVKDTEQLYRQMCFNVIMHNQDDHSRNFSFLYDEGLGRWRLSPAYDLTYSVGFMDEHATLVNGKGSDIEEGDLIEVGLSGALTERACRRILDEVEGVCGGMPTGHPIGPRMIGPRMAI